MSAGDGVVVQSRGLGQHGGEQSGEACQELHYSTEYFARHTKTGQNHLRVAGAMAQLSLGSWSTVPGRSRCSAPVGGPVVHLGSRRGSNGGGGPTIMTTSLACFCICNRIRPVHLHYIC